MKQLSKVHIECKDYQCFLNLHLVIVHKIDSRIIFSDAITYTARNDNRNAVLSGHKSTAP